MIKLKDKLKKTQMGVTLIELVMTLIVVAVTVVVLAPMTVVAGDMMFYFLHRENLKEESDVAFARLTREFRRVQDNLSIITADAQEFRFLDVDGTDLQYALSGDELTRRSGSGGTARTLLANVTSLTFTYLDDDDVAIASPNVGLGNMTELRKIRTDITLAKNNETIHLTTDISPKNFRHETDLFP